jgi:hypothetical protein
MSEQVSESLPSRILDRAHAWSPFVLALAVFLLLRPYDGIVHDARLYVGYVLASWDPQGVGQDIMFVHDGQSGYSLYPLILKVAAGALGIATAAMVLSVVSLVLWFAATWRLVWAIMPDIEAPSRAAVLVWGTSLNTLYGGGSTFHFAENFATPRPLAEALLLFAIAALVREPSDATVGRAANCSRIGTAGLLIVLAGLVHPLMIAPGLAAFVWLVPPSRWRVPFVGVGAVAVALVLAMAHWGGHPASRGALFATFDAEWLDILVRRGSIALLSQWHGVDWVRIAVQLTSLLVARHLVSGRVRALWDALVVAGVAGVLISWLATDVVYHRFLTQAQPWRVLWAVAFIAPIAVLVQLRAIGSPLQDVHAHVHALVHAKPEANSRRPLEHLATGMLLLAWFMLEVSGAAGWILLGSILLFGIARFDMSFPRAERFVRLALAGVVVLIVMLVLLRAFVVWEVYAEYPDAASRWVWRTWVTSGLPNAVVLVLALTFACVGFRPVTKAKRSRWAMPGFALGLALMSVVAFDQRTEYLRWLEGRADETEARIHSAYEGALETVFWLDADSEPWILLNQPAWGGVLQGTPKVFDRQLALAWESRAVLADSITHPDWARRSDLALRFVNAATVQTTCSWPSGPAIVVAPLDRIAAEVPRDTLRAGAPRYLPPNVRKGPWHVITAYGVIRCDGHAHTASKS